MIETKITNPGISDRLEKDVTGFEQYGFSFDASTNTFRSPSPPSAQTLDSEDEDVLDAKQKEAHLWVALPAPALVASVGPFLRTLVRMSDGVDPQKLRVVVSFCWSEGGSNDACDEDDGDGDGASAAAAATRVAHHVHMIVRNSMSAALFLTSLSILLPTKVSVGRVRDAMRKNEDVNYPSIELIERIDGKCYLHDKQKPGAANTKEGRPSPPVFISNYISFGDKGKVSARILVQTRMCTVRLTPVLYHLTRALRQECSVETLDDVNTVSQLKGQSTSFPLILACVDKVANLFRILMLVRDYRAQHRLVLVVRDERIRKRLFSEMTKFIAGLDSSDVCGHGMPRVETIEDTAALLRDECGGNIVAVDLHADALTLDSSRDDALSALRSAGAVIWGFEKDGIPDAIDNIAKCYVQVRCRSSLNLVAAMSVVLHRGWSTDFAE